MKKRFFNRKLMLVSVLMMLLVGVTAVVYAADVIVDSFDEGEQNISTTTSSFEAILHASILGGERDSYLARVSGTNTAHLEIDTGDDGKLAFTAGSGNHTAAQITWDGIDDDAAIDYDGLGGSSGDGNLLDGTNDGVLLTIDTWEGNNMDIIVRIYEDQGVNSNDYCSEATLELRGDGGGDISTPGEDYALSFDDNFSQCGSTANAVGDFGNAGAVVLFINTVADGADVILDISISTQTRDFGDLPSDYGMTTYAQDGARHSRDATYFGTEIDEEVDGFPSTDADGDDLVGSSPDDEDTGGGITRPTTPWTNGTDGGHVTFAVTSPMPNNYACVDGWIDWSDDNDFDDIDEHVIDSLRLIDISGVFDNLDQDFNVPAGTFASPTDTTISFYTRWRISPDTDGDGDCSDEVDMTYDGFVQGGEVVDHLWQFNDPTAVSLQNVSANSTSTLPAVGIIAFALLAIIGTGVALTRRQQA